MDNKYEFKIVNVKSKTTFISFLIRKFIKGNQVMETLSR